MGIISWIIFGLIAGILARFFSPGQQNINVFMTIILGIGGALVGGYISTFLGLGDITGFNFKSLIIAALGSMLIIFVYQKMKK